MGLERGVCYNDFGRSWKAETENWKMSHLVDKAKNFVAEKIADVKKPEASVDDVDFKRVSRECIEYLAKVSVTNPYSTPIPICQISYSLKSATRYSNLLLLLLLFFNFFYLAWFNLWYLSFFFYILLQNMIFFMFKIFYSFFKKAEV